MSDKPHPESIAAADAEFAFAVDVCIAISELAIARRGTAPNQRAAIHAWRLAQMRLQEALLLTEPHRHFAR